MTSEFALEANNWDGPEQDDRDYLSEAEIEAILAESPESDAYTDDELEAMAREYLERYAA